MSQIPLSQTSKSSWVWWLALLVMCFWLLVASCGGAAREARMPDPANRLTPGHTPTPYSAEQIREACPDGRQDFYRIEVPGRPTIIRITTFVKGDGESVQFSTRQEDEDGAVLGKPSSSRARWEDLQAHASFPSEQTEISQDRCQVPAGAYDCWVYRVRRREKGRLRETRFWFAKQLAGPPVLLEDETDGRRVFTMTLIRHD